MTCVELPNPISGVPASAAADLVYVDGVVRLDRDTDCLRLYPEIFNRGHYYLIERADVVVAYKWPAEALLGDLASARVPRGDLYASLGLRKDAQVLLVRARSRKAVRASSGRAPSVRRPAHAESVAS